MCKILTISNMNSWHPNGSHITKHKGYMEALNHNKINPLVYLLAGSVLENKYLRICLEDMGLKKIVTIVNTEHLKQELYRQPDIVMIDAELSNPLIPDLIQAIKAENPQTHLVFLIDRENHVEITDLLKFGAFDFAVKDIQFAQKITRIVNTVVRLKQQIG